MSTYYYIGCEACKECTPLLSQSMGGFGWMGGAVAEAPAFFEKHISCLTSLRVFDEHDWRNDDFVRFRDEDEPTQAPPSQPAPAECTPPKSGR